MINKNLLRANPIIKVYKTLSFFKTHPFSRRHFWKSTCRYFRWQFRVKLTGRPLLFQWTPKAKLWLGKGLRGASGNYYCGLHEFEHMAFLLHFLQPGDLFADVGANVGSYSVLASAHAGAEVICFEPVVASANWIRENANSNGMAEKVVVVESAVGCTKGNLHFTANLGAMNHELAHEEPGSIRVSVDTLDHLLAGRFPLLLKIDVEGHEAEVLAGASATIQSGDVQAIIIEIGNSLMPGNTGQTAHNWIISAGFNPFIYDPFTRSLSPLENINSQNTLYLRNIDFTIDRIKNAQPFSLWGEIL